MSNNIRNLKDVIKNVKKIEKTLNSMGKFVPSIYGKKRKYSFFNKKEKERLKRVEQANRGARAAQRAFPELQFKTQMDVRDGTTLYSLLKNKYKIDILDVLTTSDYTRAATEIEAVIQKYIYRETNTDIKKQYKQELKKITDKLIEKIQTRVIAGQLPQKTNKSKERWQERNNIKSMYIGKTAIRTGAFINALASRINRKR